MVAKVIFTAVADGGGNFGPFNSDTTLKFESVVTNFGDGYDRTSGIFKAPVTGYYCFSFFYQAAKNQQSGLCLVKNGSTIVKMFDKNKPGSQYTDSGGNTACLKLNAGDEVCVRLPAHCHVWASDRVTTFSGFLIAEE